MKYVDFSTRARGRCEPRTRARSAAKVQIIYGGAIWGGARVRARVNGFFFWPRSGIFGVFFGGAILGMRLVASPCFPLALCPFAGAIIII
jgi:hypothetical protein